MKAISNGETESRMKPGTCKECCEYDAPKKSAGGYCVWRGVVKGSSPACEKGIKGAWTDRIRLREDRKNARR